MAGERVKNKTILIVDDEPELREIMGSELKFMGANVLEAQNISMAQAICRAHNVDLIISDIRMPGGSGIELLTKLRSLGDKTPIVLVTGFADINKAQALDLGAQDMLYKPFQLDELYQVCDSLLFA